MVLLQRNRIPNTEPVVMIYMRKVDELKIECWAETYDNATREFKVISHSISIICGDEILIDDFLVERNYRKLGVGRKMVDKLRTTGLKVRPIGVLPKAQAFWDRVTPGWRRGVDEKVSY